MDRQETTKFVFFFFLRTCIAKNRSVHLQIGFLVLGIAQKKPYSLPFSEAYVRTTAQLNLLSAAVVVNTATAPIKRAPAIDKQLAVADSGVSMLTRRLKAVLAISNSVAPLPVLLRHSGVLSACD